MLEIATCIEAEKRRVGENKGGWRAQLRLVKMLYDTIEINAA